MIPSNATTFFTYQLSIIEDDEDDDGILLVGRTVEIHPECAEQEDESSQIDDDEITHNRDLDSDEIILYTVDCLEEDRLYPVQAKSQYSDGYVQQINVISSDDELAEITDGGKITDSYSFGTAEISAGQKTGPLTISASVNGVEHGSFETQVVNTLEQKEVRIFSPTN